MPKKPDILDLETFEGASEFLGDLSNELIDKLQAIALDEDDATKLDRATAIVRKTPPQVVALVALGLFGTVRQHEEKIETYNGLLRKLMAGALNEPEA